MRILLLDGKGIGNEDILENLTELGHKVESMPFRDEYRESKLFDLFEQKLEKYSYDFIFSFNYFPEVSKACQRLSVKYVSWVYDNPHIAVYSYTTINSCNYIFIFDYAMYDELHSAGIKTVYYMPMAINVLRMLRLDKQTEKISYDKDISFVGSMYSEKKHRLYDKLDELPEYEKGYVDALIRAQKNVYGYNFLESMLSKKLLEKLEKIYPTNPESETVLSPASIYADYILARKVTALEREEALLTLGEFTAINLYTHDSTDDMSRVKNMGPCDYYNQMPFVFRESKINLNITLKSIRTGIPLRALDIMGNGGFLISNYQEELLKYFEPEVDFVYYTSLKDLKNKVLYYLENEDERTRIAQSGCNKARELFDYRKTLTEIIEIVSSD